MRWRPHSEGKNCGESEEMRQRRWKKRAKQPCKGIDGVENTRTVHPELVIMRL